MKKLEKSILKAIGGGLKKSIDIIPYVGCEFEYEKFCEAIANLLLEGKIVLGADGFTLNKQLTWRGNTRHNTKKI